MDSDNFFEELVRLDYFRYVSKDRIPRMIAKIKQSDFLFVSATKRTYPADPKRLTKCSVKTFLVDIKSILRANGVVIKSIEEDCSREGYYITINNVAFLIYTAEELNTPNKLVWDLTTQRTFAIINKLLKDVDSNERIFSTFGGTEEWAVFLTLEIYNLLVSKGLVRIGKELFLYDNL